MSDPSGPEDDATNRSAHAGIAMKINFSPMRGHILICDFDRPPLLPPEMDKERRVVVISPHSYNHPHGGGPGRCLVVPLSATDPDRPTKADIPIAVDVYASITAPVWAICSATMAVSHARLDRVQVWPRGGYKPRFLTEILRPADMARIEEGLRHAMGMVPPPALKQVPVAPASAGGAPVAAAPATLVPTPVKKA